MGIQKRRVTEHKSAAARPQRGACPERKSHEGAQPVGWAARCPNLGSPLQIARRCKGPPRWSSKSPLPPPNGDM